MIILPTEINNIMASMNVEFRFVRTRLANKQKVFRVHFVRRNMITGKHQILYTFECAADALDQREAVIAGVRELQEKGPSLPEVTAEGTNQELQQAVATLQAELAESQRTSTVLRSQVEALKGGGPSEPAPPPVPQTPVSPPPPPAPAAPTTNLAIPPAEPAPPPPPAPEPEPEPREGYELPFEGPLPREQWSPLPEKKLMWSAKNDDIKKWLAERGLSSPPAGRRWRKMAVEALTAIDTLSKPKTEGTPEAAPAVATAG